MNSPSFSRIYHESTIGFVDSILKQYKFHILAHGQGRLNVRRLANRMSDDLDKGTSKNQTKRDLKALGMGPYRDGLFISKLPFLMANLKLSKFQNSNFSESIGIKFETNHFAHSVTKT